MRPEHYFLLLSIALAALYAVYCWHHGVVSLLWGALGALAGLAGGTFAYRFILDFLPFAVGTQLALAFFFGLIVWVVVRILSQKALAPYFELDGPLHFLSARLGGAVVSLLPTLLTLLVLATGIRIVGTLEDLRRYERLATPNADFLAKDYPRRPLSAVWRDGLESLPHLGAALDWIEPLGRVRERTLAGLLIAAKKPALDRHFAEDPATQPVIESPGVQTLRANEEIQTLNTRGDRLALLRHPALRDAALDPALGPSLPVIELHRVVDSYLLSPEYQAILESYRRDPADLVDPGR